MNVDADLQRLVEGFHHDPHAVLGVRDSPDGVIVRVRRPEAKAVSMEIDGDRYEGEHLLGGVFEIPVPRAPQASDPVHVSYDAFDVDIVDPYRFWPTLGEVDLHLIGEGRHERLWSVLGARPMEHDGVEGIAFSVWAPAARAVRVVGDWNSWDGRIHPMRALGASGVWELFVPEAEVGQRYRYEIVGADGHLRLKSDPLARQAEMPPANASVINRSTYSWRDDEWMQARREIDPVNDRLSIYEVHAGSWRTVPEEGDRPLRWDELAEQLADHVTELGFTHIELLPVAEHPFAPSWGYQVSGYFAPTSRFGSPDEFRAFVDHLHQRGIGVIVDWVPAHFPKDEWSLGRFDGTALYEHADPRQGEHPDWGTYVFNFGRNEVRNFLVANALYWLEEFHIDGLRVDAVASMLYLDYSRKDGEWLPNEHGGRENLEAIAFLQETNTVVHRAFPGVRMIAEESTAWGGVSRPVHLGGLGFGQKWNMGWMHDTLEYFKTDPVYRSHHHGQLTFGFVYAWSENFVLPLSHDEVVHGKGSLLGKMPGDDWQRFANLRALYGWMWAHPGKQLLFMGGELAQSREWSESRSLDWHLLEHAPHEGVHRLVAALNRAHAEHPAMWQRDTEPAGFDWLDASDAQQSVLAFQRNGHGDEPPVVCIANFTPVPRHGFRIGLPRPGTWDEILNTDATEFGGSGVGSGSVVSEDIPWQGREHSAVVTLPPLAVVWFAPQG
ncbi:MAG TPA: 1,4-alpha-glucan branching protein GlgB [Acidimicrobiales bacterium]|nr:1,4-alpha-glucan branching protein GlgB [Acidimicrobiales bacterium]